MSILLRSISAVLLSFTIGSVFAQVGFVENKGQFDNQISYQADYHTQTVYLDQEGFSVLLHDVEKWESWMHDLHEHKQLKLKRNPKERKLNYQHIKFEFVGANLSNFKGTETNKEHYNFFLGKDRTKWASNVLKHTTVLYKNIYPNIDLEYQAIDQRFKYNFILNDGANIDDIKINIVGANDVDVAKDRLTINSRFGSFSEVMPISYSINGGVSTTIELEYIQKDGFVGFKPKNKLVGETTVIDPELIFSTYSGSSVDNFGFTATFDSSGNLYAGGIATSPSGSFGRYPATPGAFSFTYNGGLGNEPANLACDISISKYDHTGSNLLYATYLGGASDEYPHSLIVDKNNQLIVMGTSYSSNYPTSIGAPYPLKKGGTDIILSKFSANGSTLIGSTYIGGSGVDGLNQNGRTRYFYADDFRGEVNLDTLGNIYVATCTRSTDFPVTLGAFQSDLDKYQDGVVFCFSQSLNNLKWSSYFGGNGDDAIYSIDVAADGNLFISGGTSSTNLKNTTSSIGSGYNGGRTDGFVAKISNNGRTLMRTGYWGTDGYDQILSLDLDKYGNVFVVGHSEGDMPVKGDVYYNAGASQFISKFNNGLDNVILTTVFGSGKKQPDITINAFLVDECGKIFVSGWGSSLYTGPQTPLSGMPVTSDALQKVTDGNDFHLSVFRRDALELLYATYFGGNVTDDHVDGGTSRFDKRGVIYQSVCSSCPPSSDGQTQRVSDFPTTKGAYAETNPSPRCSNASFKLAFGNLNRKPNLQEEIFTVNALDTLDFLYTVSDPDDDTISLYLTYPVKIKDAFLNRRDFYQEQTQLDADFSVNPGCELVGDTFTIEAHAFDIGCPASKDSLSRFKVVVTPPPVLEPPEVMCLNFISQNALKIEWEALVNPSRYFYRMYLHKVWPNGTSKIIDTIYSQGSGIYTDSDVINPRERNYTYYLQVENLCNELGPKSYDLSSTKEHEVPVESTYLKTVTVKDQTLSVQWLRSKEDDFGHYEVYKGERGKGSLTYLTSIYNRDQIEFIDEDVNVNKISYCYQIRISDNCGHLSMLSNYGCSIVIRGESLNKKNEVPRFKFDLNWDEYLSWKGGVADYELLRAVDTGDLVPLVRIDFNKRTYIDSDLDFDWGGYWFSVLAYEGVGSEDATSRSNDIYLIQPPLVFVPSGVTSNGDNLNDVFGWSDVFVREFEMKIYNRWGEKVFESTNKNNAWDGNYKDFGLKQSNVYVWIVTYKGWDNERHRKKGTVTIVR
mgnify:CR=1 FL=1